MTDTIETTKKQYAILRVGKIRSALTLRQVDNHNNRKVVSENVLNDTAPVELLEDGSNDFVRSARERMEELAIPRPSRRGKIIAVEVVMSASRAWFEAATDEQKQEWLDACVAWVQKKFGRGLLSVKHHLDEEVWHLHAVAIPVVLKQPRKRGRPHSDPAERQESEKLWAKKAPRWTLSYDDLFGGHRMTLSRVQDDYHSAVAHLGLDRGEKNPDVVDIELGDGLSIPIPEWQKGRPRKSIPPQEYRAIIKRLHAEVAELKAAAERDAAGIIRRVAALELKQTDAARRAAELQALKTELNQRKKTLDGKAQALAERESALLVRDGTVKKRETAVSSAEKALDEARVTVAAAEKKAKQDSEAAASALTKAQEAKAAAEAAQAAAEIMRSEAQAEGDRDKTQRELQERQMELLARAADENSGLEMMATDNGLFRMNQEKMNDSEKTAYVTPWAAPLIRMGHLLAKALVRVRSLLAAAEEKIKELASREQVLAAREKMAADNLAEAKAEYEAAAAKGELIDAAGAKASAFMKMWEHLPETLRPPEVGPALAAAKDFTADWPLSDYGSKDHGGAGR